MKNLIFANILANCEHDRVFEYLMVSVDSFPCLTLVALLYRYFMLKRSDYVNVFSFVFYCSYGLSYEEVEKGLPKIDTSRTLIREVCPAFLANVECKPGKYRRYDGLCTNVKHPTWGATNTPFTR